MTFVKVHAGGFVALEIVREVLPGPDDDHVTLTLAGGGGRWTTKEIWDEALRGLGTHVVPASPNTFRLFATILGDQMVDIRREPVIAWSVDQAGRPDPISMWTDFNRHDGDVDVEFADGTVQGATGTYKSVAEWIDVWRSLSRAATDPKFCDMADHQKNQVSH